MTKHQSGVAIDVKVGEELHLELDPSLELDLGLIKVLVERKDGQRARLRVVADQRIIVRRPTRNMA
jgi:hypothetical protein